MCLDNKLEDRKFWSKGYQAFPKFKLALILFSMNKILICWNFSQICELCCTSEAFTIYFVLLRFLALCPRDINIYLVLSAFTSRPVFLLATNKASVYFSTLGTHVHVCFHSLIRHH